MRCTRVTQECRRRQKYSVERADGAAYVFPPFQAFTRQICSGYGSAMSGRAIACACRMFGTTLNLLRQATCHEDLFTASRAEGRSAERRSLQLCISQAQTPPDQELLPRQPLFSVLTICLFRKAVPLSRPETISQRRNTPPDICIV